MVPSQHSGLGDWWWSALVLLVAHLLQPLDHLAVELLLDGDVGHGRGRGRAVPVLFARREPNHVTRPDLFDRPAPPLYLAAPRRDNECLPERVSVPRRPCARLEGHAGSGRAGWCWRLEQRV